MSEGGLLQWKCQRHDQHRGPSCDYGDLKNPLPDPPKGSAWAYNPKTKEWCITQIQLLAVTGDDICKSDGQTIQEPATVSPECADSGNVDGGSMVDGTVRKDDDGYTSHRLRSTDTFQGLCLKYKVAPTTLRQLNRFSGSNLSQAPPTLIVPTGTSSPSKSAGPYVTDVDPNPEEQNIHRFLHALKFFLLGRGQTGNKKTLGRREAIAYLDMNDGNLEDAIQDAKDDIGWEGGR